MKASIGIVGPNGFLGKSISSYFSSSGYPIVPITRENLKLLLENASSNSLINLDYLLWLGSSVNPQSAEFREDLISQDLKDLQDLTNCMKVTRSRRQTNIIFVSSGGCVYSSKEPPFNEESAAYGNNRYGIYKRAAEVIIEDSGLPYVVVRASNIYGPNQPVGRGQGVIAEWIHSAQNKEPLKVFGNLENSRDFLYIDDFINALEAVILNDFEGTVNIGAGKPTSLRKVIENIKAISKTELSLEFHPSRGIDRREYFLDIAKAKAYFGWEPTTSIESGIRATFIGRT